MRRKRREAATGVGAATVALVRRAQMAELPRTSSRSKLSIGKIIKERDDLKKAMEVLQGVPLFSELTATQLERLANSLRRKEIRTDASGKFSHNDDNFPDGVVIHQGDHGDASHAMYVVESGHLQACVDVVRSVSNPDGVVKEYAAGDFFGELAIVTDQARSATVRCVETTVLLELERSDVLELLPGQLNNLISAHRRNTAIQVLKKVPIFSDLSQSKIEELSYNLKRKEIMTDKDGLFPASDPEFPNGEVIRQGEQGDTMFVVESGCAPLTLLPVLLLLLHSTEQLVAVSTQPLASVCRCGKICIQSGWCCERVWLK